ncbi:MAG: single-stranded DNA-binding protein [Ruminiclostridium sp.]|nr:single-stranded DNA-binding protein [Ruminiclostridium sp.]
MESINEVELTGSIVDIYSLQDYLAVTISVKKYAEMPKSEQNIKDYPRVVWFGEAANALSGKLTRYDYVDVTAIADAALVTKDGKAVRRLTLVGKDIKPAKTRCDKYFGIVPDIGASYDYKNIVKLRGSVVQTYSPDNTENFSKFVIKVVGARSFSYPEIICYAQTADFVKSKLAVNDTVCVTGTIQTYAKEQENGSRSHSTSIVCREIAVVKEQA